MTEPRPTSASEDSLMRDLLHAARYYLGDRRVLAVLAGVAIAIALAFNWSWLIAIGIAPLLVATLPCIAMCALGLCMNKAMGRSCDAGTASRGTDMDHETRRDRTPPTQLQADPSAAGPRKVAVVTTARMPRPPDHSEKEKSDA